MIEEAFKDKAMGKTQVYEWFNCFKWTEIFVEDQPHCGHHTVSKTDENVEKVLQTVLRDRRRTIDEISEVTYVS